MKYSNKNYRFKITKAERFFIIKILRNHKCSISRSGVRPAYQITNLKIFIRSAVQIFDL